ncbi:MAG: hypothetical protein LBH43_16245 [Treponema sp.]|nr:hypothetical protein [Treponema sp.]
MSSYYVSEYDSKGNRTKWSFYDANGNLTWYTESEYDSNGNRTKYSIYDENGNLERYTVYTYKRV